jgi:uncharacterized protein
LTLMDKATEIWRVPIAVEAIPEGGLHLKLEAPEAVRVALAPAAGLRSLPAFEASFDLARRGKGVHVGGRVEAIVGQTCVVTLEPPVFTGCSAGRSRRDRGGTEHWLRSG